MDQDCRFDLLYLTYDGVLEPLGRSQVLSYLGALAEEGLRVAIVSFEKPELLRGHAPVQALRANLAAHGMTWYPLLYHRTPRVLGTAWDLARGASRAWRLTRRGHPVALHARSYVAGLMGAAVKRLTRTPFVFDMRGFWPEERVEMGLFRPQGSLYRAAKLSERLLLASADHVVVLTESAKAILRDREARGHLASGNEREKPITVIPCCVDLDRFASRPRDAELAATHGLEDRLVIGNIGAVNRRYLTHEMFRFAFHAKSHLPRLRFVYLTQQDPEEVFRASLAAGLERDDVLVAPAAPSDVPRWLTLYRLGVFFLRPSYAAKASSFTKLGEFLAAGVPVITNTGVGDVDRILGSERTGLLVHGLTDRDLAVAAKKALPLLEGERVPMETARACRDIAAAHFDLTDGACRYQAVYRSLGLDRAAEAPSESPPTVAEVG